jgi:hypothetical protein
MSDTPTGPWTSKGYIMRPTDRSRGNHPGIIDYKGHSYVFGLNYDIMHLKTLEHHERRSVSAAEITYNADGTIQEIPYWLDQKPLKQLEPFNPYRRVEAETMNWGYGLKTKKKANGIYVTNIDNGEYIRLRGVDFGKKGPKKFTAAVAAQEKGAEIVLRINSINGPVMGRLKIPATGGDLIFKQASCKVVHIKGIHDLYLCFRLPSPETTFNFDYWKF